MYRNRARSMVERRHKDKQVLIVALMNAMSDV